MKNIKFSLCIIAIALLVVGLLGCGGGEDLSNQRKVKYLSPEQTLSARKAYAKAVYGDGQYKFEYIQLSLCAKIDERDFAVVVYDGNGAKQKAYEEWTYGGKFVYACVSTAYNLYYFNSAEGKIFAFDRAYDDGLIDENALCGVTAELNAIDGLSEEKVRDIRKAYYESGINRANYDFYDLYSVEITYYGEYGDINVFDYVDGNFEYLPDVGDEVVIDGVTICTNTLGFSAPLVYLNENKSVVTLKQAYGDGLITKEDLLKIADAANK